MWKRVALIVIGAALLGSGAATLTLHFLLGGGWIELEGRRILGLVLASLIFTLPGSMALLLFYSKIEESGPYLLRYCLIIAAGGVAGAAWLLVLFRTSSSAALGCAYGVATAVAWAALHCLTEPPQEAKDRRP